MRHKRVHVVTTKGRKYVYAWRGGPRIEVDDSHPGFDAAYTAAVARHRSVAGGRKRALPLTPRYQRTVEDSIRAAIGNAKQRAPKKRVAFDIDEAYAMELFKEAGGRCQISGIEFVPSFDPEGRYSHNPFGVSIDRIEPAKGYVRGNVRLVLTAVNFSINQWGLPAYLKIAEAVARRSR
jgi:hypothetical protein